MTDVVEIAQECRDVLAAEIARIDEFLRMAQMLVKYNPPKSNKASGSEDEKAAGGNGAEAEREDLPVRELTVKELVRKSRTIHNEPALDRREHFQFQERA